MGFRPTPRRTDSPPPRGPRFGGNESRESRPHDRRDSRNRERDTHPERDRSRSPYSRRDSDRYDRAGERSEKYDLPATNYPSSWNIYRPEYPRGRKSEDTWKPTHTQRSSSASPFHAPDRPQQSENSKKDSMPGNTQEDQARRAPKGGLASNSIKAGHNVQNSRKPSINNDQDINLQIPGLDLAGFQVSPTLHPVSPPELVPATTVGALASLDMERATPTVGEVPTEALGIVSKNLAEQAAKLSTLRFKLQRAAHNLQRRKTEFEKSKPYHEKYPDIKQSHGSNIKEAEKTVSSFKAEVKAQEIVLDDLALRTANISLPAIISQAQHGSNNQEALEKVVQTCAGFSELLESQQKLISELQRDKEQSTKVYQELKEHLEAELKLLRDQVYTIIPQDQLKLQGSIEEVKRGAVELGTTVSLLSTKSTEQGSNISTLSNRTGDMGAIREELKKLTNSSPETSRQITDLSMSHEGLLQRLSDIEPLKSIPTTIAKNQKEFEEALEGINTRLRSVELRPDIASVESRFQTLERLTPQPTPDLATKKDLDALKERVKRVEGVPSPKSAPNLLNAQLAGETSILDRIAELERRLGSTANATQDMTAEEKLHHLSESIQTTTSPTRGSKSLPDLSDVERRLFALERGGRDRVASASNPNEAETEVSRLPVEQRLAEMANEIEFLKTGQEVLEECIGTTVSQGIEMAIADSGTKLEALQSQLEKSKSELETLRGAHDNLHGHLAAALDPTNGIENRMGRIVQNFSNAFNKESQKTSQECERVNNELSSLTHGLNNLTSRIENINTKELAHYMLGQVADIFPNLQDTEATIRDIRTALFELAEKVRSGLAAQQTKNVPGSEVKALQEQIRSLTQKISEFDTIAKQSKQTAALATSSIVELRTELLDQLRTDRNFVADAIGGSGSKLDDLTRMVTGQNEQIEALKQVSSRPMDPQLSVTTTSAPQARLQGSTKATNLLRGSSIGPAAAHSNIRPASSSKKQGVQGSAPSGNIRAPNLSPNRQSSVASVASDSRKQLKRKHSVSGASNSFNNSKSSSPERKKARRATRVPIPESDEDPEYDPEDDIPQPQMGSDDNE